LVYLLWGLCGRCVRASLVCALVLAQARQPTMPRQLRGKRCVQQSPENSASTRICRIHGLRFLSGCLSFCVLGRHCCKIRSPRATNTHHNGLSDHLQIVIVYEMQRVCYRVFPFHVLCCISRNQNQSGTRTAASWRT